MAHQVLKEISSIQPIAKSFILYNFWHLKSPTLVSIIKEDGKATGNTIESLFHLHISLSQKWWNIVQKNFKWNDRQIIFRTKHLC